MRSNRDFPLGFDGSERVLEAVLSRLTSGYSIGEEVTQKRHENDPKTAADTNAAPKARLMENPGSTNNPTIILII